jgi:uncharacterized protein (TIGR03435 family)
LNLGKRPGEPGHPVAILAEHAEGRSERRSGLAFRLSIACYVDHSHSTIIDGGRGGIRRATQKCYLYSTKLKFSLRHENRAQIPNAVIKRGFEKMSRAKKSLAGAIAICVMIGSSATIRAQSPEFNAASIKLNKSGDCSHGCGVRFLPAMVSSFPGGTSIRRIIQEAYHLSPYQLFGGPDWLDSDMFDLEAKAETPVDENGLRLMLQTLLSRRFKLVSHHETREAAIYALTVGKGGAKVHELKEGDPPKAQTFVSAAAALPGTPAPTLRFSSIKQFAVASESNPLANLGRPVVDKTGLQGQYLFTFSWDPSEDYMGAVEEELGLKFVSQKAPLDFLIIDHIEKPDPN